MPRRGLVVLISDLFFPADEVFSALDHFRFRGHDLLVLQVLDPVERSMPLDGMVRFHDLETGEEMLTRADEIRPAYQAAVDGWLGELDAGCLGREIDRAVLTTDEPPDRALVEYLGRRSAPLIDQRIEAADSMGGLGFIHGGFPGGRRWRSRPCRSWSTCCSAARPRGSTLGSLRFLRVALRDNAHRRKIRRWLLLALRIGGRAPARPPVRPALLVGARRPRPGARGRVLIDRRPAWGPAARAGRPSTGPRTRPPRA